MTVAFDGVEYIFHFWFEKYTNNLWINVSKKLFRFMSATFFATEIIQTQNKVR